MDIEAILSPYPIKYKKGPEPTSCWIWQGHITSKKYGRVKHRGKCYLVHRLSYIRRYGPIPEYLEIDHLCHNRACFNPIHLQAVTHKENALRGNSGRHLLERKQCPYGHKYTIANTGYSVSKDKQIRRYCRKCKNSRNRKSQLTKNRLCPIVGKIKNAKIK